MNKGTHALPDQESQRLYSVAPLVLRKALGDIRVGQYTIPAGTAILIHVFAMHNTSANYERHAEFLPVRQIWHACWMPAPFLFSVQHHGVQQDGAFHNF